MKKKISLLLSLAMIAALFAGCGSKQESSSAPAAESTGAVEEAATTPSTAEAPAAPETASVPEESVQAPAAAETGTVDMPLADHDVTLGLWIEFPPFLEGSSYSDPSQFPFYQNLSEVSGIDLSFTTVSMAAASEQFNLAVASQSFPDIVCNPGYYTGSVDDAIENDVFFDATNLLPEYAPNYLAVINRDDETRRAAYSQDGRVGVFWEIAKEAFPANSGLVIRQDWLDALDLKVPATYDEFHDVLAAFREHYQIESPIYTDSNSLFLELSSGYYFMEDFINMDGTAVFSAASERFRDYVTMMHQWYQDGLIYKDYYVYSENNVQSDEVKTRLVNSNQVGVWYNWCEDLQRYEVEDPAFALTAITNPVLKAGDEIHLCSGVDPMVSTSGGWAISTNCTEEHIPYAMQLIDYLYTEDGSILANWGIEGDTFYYQEDGTPRYTDVILNNPEFATNMAIGLYCVFRGPILSDLSRFNQNVVGELKAYCDVWGQQDNSYAMPAVSMNAADSERFNSLKTDIDTALNENLPAFIIGDRPIEELDGFLAQLDSMGMEEMVALEQAALDSYYQK